MNIINFKPLRNIHTYAQYFNTIDGKIIAACGTMAVYVLDGRQPTDKLISEAKSHGSALKRAGHNFTHVQIIQKKHELTQVIEINEKGVI